MAEVQAPKINQEELIKKVEDLEKRLQTKDAEIQVYKMLVSQMEEDASQAKRYKALHEKQTQDVDFVRTESEKTLTKAKSMIFEKTKVIKNQELQIEAFTQQIDSLKEVIRITKDLLEIRNLEVQQLEIKISSMEGKQKGEKERYDLMHKKLEMMIRHNGDLKREYETQLCLFTALRERYNERELAKGVIDNLRQGGGANNARNANPEVVNNIVVANNESEAGINNASPDHTNTTNNGDIDISNHANPIPEQNSDATSHTKNTVNNEIENVVDIASANKEVNVQPVTPVANQQIQTVEQITEQNSTKNANSTSTTVNNEIGTKAESVNENTPANKEVNEVSVQPVTLGTNQQISTPQQITEQNSAKNANPTSTAVNNEIGTKTENVNDNTSPNKEVTEVKVQHSNEVNISGQIEVVSENPVQKTE